MPMDQPVLEDPSLNPFPGDARLCQVDNENQASHRSSPSQPNRSPRRVSETKAKCGLCIQETLILIGTPEPFSLEGFSDAVCIQSRLLTTVAIQLPQNLAIVGKNQAYTVNECPA